MRIVKEDWVRDSFKMRSYIIVFFLLNGLFSIGQNNCVNLQLKEQLLTAFFHHPHVARNYVHAEIPERLPISFFRSDFFQEDFCPVLYGRPIELQCSEEFPELIYFELLEAECEPGKYTVSAFFKAENASVVAELIGDYSKGYRVEILREVEY